MTDNSFDFKTFFEALPGSFLILLPDAPLYTIVAANDDVLRDTSKLRQEVIGKSIFEVYPQNPDEVTATGPSHIKTSLDKVLKTKKQNRLPFVRYDVLNADGIFEARYWSPLHKPILDEAGEVAYIIHAPIEVTEQVNAEKKGQQLRQIEKTYKLFMQAPVAVSIVSGPEHIVELANDEFLNTIGKTTQIVGKPLFESIPDALSQGFPELLEGVRQSGKPYHATEYPTKVVVDGKEELQFYNFVYQPYYANPGDNMPSGVITAGHNVTGQVLAKKKLEESEFRFRNLIEETPVPTSLLKGPEFIIEVANEAMISIWGKGSSVVGKTLIEALPELEGQPFLQILDDVFTSGKAYEAKAAETILVRDGVAGTYYFDFTYKPLFNTQGEVYAIIDAAIDVTDKVLAEKQLEEEKAYLQSAIDIGELGTFKVDVAGSTITYSETIRQWFGLTDLKQSIEALVSKVHAEDTQILMDVLAKSTGAKSDTRHDIIYRVFDAARKIRHLRSIGKTLFKHGQLKSINGLIQDVSLQVNAGLRLQESESLFRSMIQQAPIAIALTRGRDIVFETINALMLQQIGKSTMDQVLGKKFADVLPELLTQPGFPIVVNVFDTGEPFNAWEVPIYLIKDGEPELHYFNLSYSPLIENGKITGVLHVSLDVTEQVLSRKKVEESREELKRFKFMADNARDAFLLMREDGSFAYLNPKALEFWGYTEEEAKSLRVPDVDPIYNDELFSQTFAQAQKGNIPIVKSLNKRKDGSIFPIEGTLAALMLNGVPYLFGVERDITERQQAEEALKESEESFRTFANNIQNLAWMATPEGWIFWYNQRWYDYTGTTFEQMQGWGWEKVHHPDHIERVVEFVKQAWGKGETWELIFPLKGSHGQYRWFLTRAYAVKDAQGKVLRWIGTNTDIDDQKRAEAALKESESRFRRISDSNIIAIAFWNTDGFVTDANKAFLDMLGFSYEELLAGKVEWNERIHPEYRELHAENIQRAIEGQSVEPYETKMRCKDGGEVNVLVGYAMLEGSKTEGLAYLLNITEQVASRQKIEKREKEAQALAEELASSNEELQAANKEILAKNEDLREANDQLMRTNTDLDNFVYTASHDLKAPISNIEGLLQMLLRTLPLETMQEERIRHITAMMGVSVERFKKTITSLTQIVKLQKENSQPATQVDLQTVIREVILDLEPMIRSLKAELTLEIENSQRVRFSEKNLRSIIYNLLSNALKYHSPDRVPRVLIRCQSTQAYLVLFIRDNGLGMEKGALKQLFTMFKRFHEHVEGSGIGLYMVKKMVENAGGRIEVESRVGEGSTFRAYFKH